MKRQGTEMQGIVRVRGLNVEEPEAWRVVFQGADPAQLDRLVDEYHSQLGVANVRVEVTLSRGEKAKITRTVLKRDGRKCRKCASAVDVQVVSLRVGEYHNPDELVTLCRVCRRARKIVVDNPYDETAVASWLANGRTGIQELVDDFRRKYPDAYVELEKLAGVEGAAEFTESTIMLTAFGGNPFLNEALSPQLIEALEEHSKRDPIPDSFLDTEPDSR